MVAVNDTVPVALLEKVNEDGVALGDGVPVDVSAKEQDGE